MMLKSLQSNLLEKRSKIKKKNSEKSRIRRKELDLKLQNKNRKKKLIKKTVNGRLSSLYSDGC